MVLNFAHRGSLSEAPENSLLSFEKALKQGAKGIELDVQLTKDNVLVVCHDHKLTRFNHSSTELIKNMTWEELKRIDISASFGDTYGPVHVPRLENVLELVPEDIYLNIEIKNIPVLYDGIEERVLSCLSYYNRLNRVIISSFDHVALQKIHALNSHIPLGMLFHYRLLDTWKYVQQSNLPIYSIHLNHVFVDQTFVQYCKQAGYHVYPYTVNDMERYEQLISYGVDGVFSNNPVIFKI
ncbi:glycerophosphodiester phosphodiesterase [Oceanobacillus kimchii]|uniref:glycerophosphodiester phosphodiesterase n=1 Tax=Oceanobacillus kimchii TaxID=746691 RepID=UPI00158A9F67|nr:glycerophosphodiester phosphodiesterase family protein [Oceanobacillus kimchii]